MNKVLNSRSIITGILAAAGFICAPIAQAALEDLGNGVIKDTDLVPGIVWLADANNSKTSGYNTDGLMTWSAANNWVNQLNAGGHSDWRLPTTSEFSHLFYSELDGVQDHNIYDTHNNANFALFSNIQAPHYTNAYTYWTATPTDDTNVHSTFGFNAGRDFTDNRDVGHYAMAVATIPEPETYAMLLAGLGLVSLFARRRKQIS
jgi:hypothetical protein